MTATTVARGDRSPGSSPRRTSPTSRPAFGTGLIEALNVSEGRGTTTPFLWFGAPFITESQIDQMIADLHGAELPGVLARPMFATPTTSKHEGEFCGGVQLHITDMDAYEPVRTGIHVVATLLRTVEGRLAQGSDCRTRPTCRMTSRAQTHPAMPGRRGRRGHRPPGGANAAELTSKRYRIY